MGSLAQVCASVHSYTPSSVHVGVSQDLFQRSTGFVVMIPGACEPETLLINAYFV